MLYPLPAPVKTAAEALSGGGIQAYLVGGCVRDIIRGASPHDFDIAVPSPPDVTADCFPGRTLILDGVKHGTVAVMISGEKIEITTFRSEGGYSDGRHPDAVSFTKDIISDLARRDFTVNAMAIPLAGGYADTEKTADPFGGRDDISRRLIRCVGDPYARFSEDGLRVMRALRFSSVLGYDIEEKTADAALRCACMLGSVSRERIADELYKTAAGEHAASVIDRFSGIIETAAGAKAQRTEPLRYAPPDPLTRLILLFGSEAPNVLRRLKRSRADIGTAMRVTEAMDLPSRGREAVYRLLIRLGSGDIKRLFDIKLALGEISADERASALETADELIRSSAPLSEGDLALRGSDLAKMGYSGTQIGEIKKRLFEAVVSGEARNTRDDLLELVRKSP